MSLESRKFSSNIGLVSEYKEASWKFRETNKVALKIGRAETNVQCTRKEEAET